MTNYKVVDGTSYHEDTPDNLIEILENARKNHTRIIIDYGDVKTGKSWHEQFDIKGYVGRSTGIIKIPLLVYNTRTSGGGGILTNSILSVKTTRGG